MIIPNNLRINGMEYTINNPDSLDDGTSVLYGNVSYSNCEININDKNQCYQHKCVTLWHEIAHVILHNAGIELEQENLEKICDAFGYGIYQILQDNVLSMYNVNTNYEESGGNG